MLQESSRHYTPKELKRVKLMQLWFTLCSIWMIQLVSVLSLIKIVAGSRLCILFMMSPCVRKVNRWYITLLVDPFYVTGQVLYHLKKNQKTLDFLIFSGGMERKYGYEMSEIGHILE